MRVTQEYMKRDLLCKVSMILSLLLSVGVTTFFRACPAEPDGSFLVCHSVQRAVLYTGTGMMVLSAVPLFVDRKPVTLPVAAVNVLLSTLVYLMPGILMELCLATGRRCHVFMQPFVRVCSLAILICNAALFFTVLRQESPEDEGSKEAEPEEA